MKKKLYRTFVELSGNPVQSYMLRKFTTSKVSKYLNKSFVKTYKINEDEMEYPLHKYETLHDLFIRKLKDDARFIDKDENSVVSPVDGVLADIGKISEKCTFHVKNQDYSVYEMLGNRDKVRKYQNGIYIILYLSPSHYHRIHTPVSGTIVGKWALGTKSYPVNETGLRLGKRPLSRNYRLVTEFSLENNKHYAVVKVGALNVNSIHTTYQQKELQKGTELGYFSFGSTVVLLFEKDTFKLDETIKVSMDVKVGMKIGTLL